MADFVTVAQEFTNYYYRTFDTNRADLSPLYGEESMLTFESSQTQGAGAIVEKLTNLPFAKVQHQVSTVDAQPAGPDGSIIVLVTGHLVVDEEQNPMKYSQCFHLIPRAGSYYVRNDVFRLVYG